MSTRMNLHRCPIQSTDLNILTVRQIRSELRNQGLTSGINFLANTRKQTLINYLIQHLNNNDISEVHFLPDIYIKICAAMINRNGNVEYYPIASLFYLTISHLRTLARSKNSRVSGPKIQILRNFMNALPPNQVYPLDRRYITSGSFWFWLSQNIDMLCNIANFHNIDLDNCDDVELSRRLADANIPIVHSERYEGNYLYRLGLTGLRGFAQALELSFTGQSKYRLFSSICEELMNRNQFNENEYNMIIHPNFCELVNTAHTILDNMCIIYNVQYEVYALWSK